MIHEALRKLCWSFIEVYGFTMENEQQVRAAMEAEESVLKAIFPDGEYNSFYRYMIFLKEKQAELDIFDKPIQFKWDENNNKPLWEHIKSELMNEEKYAPLLDRDDFKALSN